MKILKVRLQFQSIVLVLKISVLGKPCVLSNVEFIAQVPETETTPSEFKTEATPSEVGTVARVYQYSFNTI